MSMPNNMRCLALWAALLASGCGTMANLDGRQLPANSPPGEVLTTPFGGVKRDVAWAKTAESTDKLRYVADLPLSFFGDLVTLPKTVIGTHSDVLLKDYDASATAANAGQQAKAFVGP
jgi:uncharacterized protein YceK